MSETEYVNQVAEMQEAALRQRGLIITGAVTLESSINLFLAIHFCGESDIAIELIETVFATRKYTFDSKRDTFQAILNKEPKRYNVPDIKELCKKIKSIGEKRNMFAHWPLDNSKECLLLFQYDEMFTFVKIENSTQQESISFAEIEQLKTDISNCAKVVSKLHDNKHTSPDKV